MHLAQINPIRLTPKTAYLAGLIIGDGHISNCSKSQSDRSRDYRIVIELTDLDYAMLILKLIKSVIPTKSAFRIPKARGSRKKSFYIQIRNKSFFYFLTNIMGVPAGAKSSIVSIPNKIKESSLNIKKHFIAGLFDTDGGLRSNTIGFCTASEQLIIDMSNLLTEFLIKHKLESWENRKYRRVYYGLLIAKSEIDSFLNMFPLQNTEKLIRILKKFCGDAGAAKQNLTFGPNGTV
jgi:intein/homing endonuclease